MLNKKVRPTLRCRIHFFYALCCWPLLFACEKIEITADEMRANLIGTWDTEVKISSYSLSGELESENTYSGTFRITANGKVVATTGIIGNGNWYYHHEAPRAMVLTSDLVTSGQSPIFTGRWLAIEKNTPNEHIWKSDQEFDYLISGAWREVTVYKLTR